MKPIYVSLSRTPALSCPRCRVQLQCASGLTLGGRPAEPVIPEPGSVTCCRECVTWCVVTEFHQLRLASADEIAAIDPELRTIAERLARELRLPGDGLRH